MIRRNHSDHDAFADWLDAGRPAGLGLPSEPGDDLQEAREGLVQIDALNHRIEQYALAVAPARTSLASILAAAGVQPTLGMPDHSTQSQQKEQHVANTLSYPISQVPYGGFAPGASFKRVLSVAAIVAIILAASMTAWVNRDQLGGGGGDGLETLSYAAFMLDDGQEFEIAYDVPTAEDCTVEPLTVDQVMQKLSTTYVSGQGTDAKATAMAMLEAGTPLPEPPPHDYTLPEETHADITAVQREWLACSLYGTPFQRWALETDRRVQNEFQQRYMPVMDMAVIQQDLEDLAAGKENRLSGSTLTEESTLPMVPTYVDGLYNINQGVGVAEITVFWVRPDGTALVNFGETLEDLAPIMSAPSVEQTLPNDWTFRMNAETGQWQLDSMRLTGG